MTYQQWRTALVDLLSALDHAKWAQANIESGDLRQAILILKDELDKLRAYVWDDAATADPPSIYT